MSWFLGLHFLSYARGGVDPILLGKTANATRDFLTKRLSHLGVSDLVRSFMNLLFVVFCWCPFAYFQLVSNGVMHATRVPQRPQSFI